MNSNDFARIPIFNFVLCREIVVNFRQIHLEAMAFQQTNVDRIVLIPHRIESDILVFKANRILN